MTRLLIVRHGQTVWNTQHRMQGQQNSPLTDTGRELARRLALRLRGVPLDGILTSPLGRAVDTARILAGGSDVRVEDRLRELDLGRWEGEDMRTMEERYPIDFESFWQNPNRYMELRGGETYDSLLERTGELLRASTPVMNAPGLLKPTSFCPSWGSACSSASPTKPGRQLWRSASRTPRG